MPVPLDVQEGAMRQTSKMPTCSPKRLKFAGEEAMIGKAWGCKMGLHEKAEELGALTPTF